MKPYLIAGVLSLFVVSTPLHAALSWSSQAPLIAESQTKKEAVSGHGHGGHGRAKSFYLLDSANAEAEIWFPTLVRRPLNIGDGGEVSVAGTGVDNYHLLYARKKSEGRDELALRYHYLNGKPTGESPRKLIAYRKGALDIVPSPLTREHQRYLSGVTASYTILFKNKPLASQTVALTTSNGSVREFHTDEKGQVMVVLPDDFEGVQPGRRANRPAEFVLTTKHSDQGVEYHSTLSAAYYVNPSHWQSSLGGGLAMLAGFVGGLVAVRRQCKRAQESSDA